MTALTLAEVGTAGTSPNVFPPSPMWPMVLMTLVVWLIPLALAGFGVWYLLRLLRVLERIADGLTRDKPQ